jgi:hypothetical protein
VGTETIDGGGVITVSGNNASGVFQVHSYVQAALTGLTIRGGNSDYGGGIYNYAFATLTVSNSTVSGNSALAGGGIFNYVLGSLTVSNASFLLNSAGAGAGIYNDDGTLAVSNATFSGNSASQDGGGIYNDVGTLTVSNATFNLNSAINNGGGLLNRAGALTMSNATLSGNVAGFAGGGIYNSGSGTLAVSNATLSGNSAIFGGGINNKGTLAVSNATFYGNSANSQEVSVSLNGGGIFNQIGATLTVQNATLSGNYAFNTGGGIANDGTLTMQSTIVAGNTTSFSDEADVSERGVDGGSTYNVIGTATGSGLSFDFNGNQFLLGVIPLRLGPLGNYGGPTQTMPLLPGSPALGQGAPGGAGVPTTDQRGFPRPTSGRVDVGAFQKQSNLLQVKTADLGGLAAKMSMREAINQANQDAMAGQSDTITFDLAQMGTSTVTLLDGPLVLDVSGAAGPVGTETIDGGGVIRVSGNHASGVFVVNTGVLATLTGLTIQDGSAFAGGGILNYGALSVSNTTVRGNSAFAGGGIYNLGALAVNSATLSGNAAFDGAGIYNQGALMATNATLSGNAASDSGGAVVNADAGTATLSNATLSGNTANTAGGIFNDLLATLTLQSTIVAANTAAFAADVQQQGVDGGSADNLIGDGSDSGLSDGVNGNQVGGNGLPVLDPLLGPLADNGGPTETMALLPGSPALAGGAFAGSDGAETDQRGLPWPTSGQVDVGAFQTQTTAVAAGDVTVSYSAASQDVTLTATVTDNGGAMPLAQGSVAFTVLMPDGTDLTATADIDAGGTASASVTLPAGLVVGSYTIAVAYSDSAAIFSPSSGSSILTVQPATPCVEVAATSLSFSATANQSATLTATIIAGGLGIGEGSVSFIVSAPSAAAPGDPPIVLATTAAVPVNALGVVSVPIPVPAGSLGGVYTIQAVFTDEPGTGNYAPADGAGILTIDPATTTVTLNAVPARTFSNGSAQSVSLSAHVTSPAGKVMTGSVTFTIAGQPPVTAPVNLLGVASALVAIPAGTAAGSYAITATYADLTNAIGGTNFAGSPVSGTLTIKPAATKVTASGSAAYRAGAGQQVTLTARVTAGGKNVVNEGTVTFTYAGQTVQGTVNAQGVATAKVTVTAGTAAGAYPFTVAYGGTANFLPTTATGTLTIKPDATHVKVAPTKVAYSASADQQVTITATVTAGLGGPVSEGSVTFTYGAQTITVAVNSQGVATATLTVKADTARGKYTLTASYADILNLNNKVNYSLSTAQGTLEVF